MTAHQWGSAVYHNWPFEHWRMLFKVADTWRILSRRCGCMFFVCHLLHGWLRDAVITVMAGHYSIKFYYIILSFMYICYARFSLTTRSTRSSRIKLSGTGLARSTGMIGWSTFLGITMSHAKKVRQAIARQAILYWSSTVRVDGETIG